MSTPWLGFWEPGMPRPNICCAQMYVCPTSGETECLVHSGFDNCCNHPDCPGHVWGRWKMFRARLGDLLDVMPWHCWRQGHTWRRCPARRGVRPECEDCRSEQDERGH